MSKISKTTWIGILFACIGTFQVISKGNFKEALKDPNVWIAVAGAALGKAAADQNPGNRDNY